MLYLISKAMIIGCSLTLALLQFPLTACVAALLTMFTASGMHDFFENRILSYALFIICCIATLFFPVLGCFLPVFSYDCGSTPADVREKYPALAAMLIIWAFLFTRQTLPFWVIEGALGILSFFSALALYRTDVLTVIIRHNRDTDRENQLLLEQKNATLLENTQYEIETATLRERNRIAREIHDNVGHLLTRSILQVGALNTINQNEQLAPHLEQLSDTLNQAMDSIRSSVHNLYRTELDLRTSLETYLASVEKLQTNLRYEIDYLPREISCHFLSIIKEAVHNTIRHSNADRIDIRLIEHPRFYQLTIEDNGADSGTTQAAPGMGLTSMQERVSLMNGSMEIFHEHGFRIFITVMK